MVVAVAVAVLAAVMVVAVSTVAVLAWALPCAMPKDALT